MKRSRFKKVLNLNLRGKLELRRIKSKVFLREKLFELQFLWSKTRVMKSQKLKLKFP